MTPTQVFSCKYFFKHESNTSQFKVSHTFQKRNLDPVQHLWVFFQKYLIAWAKDFVTNNFQKQASRGVLKKRCSENMHQIYRGTPMPKCDFNKIALQLYWNRTSGWMFSCNLLHIFRILFLKNTCGWLLLNFLSPKVSIKFTVQSERFKVSS